MQESSRGFEMQVVDYFEAPLEQPGSSRSAASNMEMPVADRPVSAAPTAANSLAACSAPATGSRGRGGAGKHGSGGGKRGGRSSGHRSRSSKEPGHESRSSKEPAHGSRSSKERGHGGRSSKEPKSQSSAAVSMSVEESPRKRLKLIGEVSAEAAGNPAAHAAESSPARPVDESKHVAARSSPMSSSPVTSALKAVGNFGKTIIDKVRGTPVTTTAAPAGAEAGRLFSTAPRPGGLMELMRARGTLRGGNLPPSSVPSDGGLPAHPVVSAGAPAPLQPQIVAAPVMPAHPVVSAGPPAPLQPQIVAAPVMPAHQVVSAGPPAQLQPQIVAVTVMPAPLPKMPSLPSSAPAAFTTPGCKASTSRQGKGVDQIKGKHVSIMTAKKFRRSSMARLGVQASSSKVAAIAAVVDTCESTTSGSKLEKQANCDPKPPAPAKKKRQRSSWHGKAPDQVAGKGSASAISTASQSPAKSRPRGKEKQAAKKSRPPVPSFSGHVDRPPPSPPKEPWLLLRQVDLSPKKDEDNYEISERDENSDDGGGEIVEEPDRSHKHVPEWSDKYLEALTKQEHMDPDSIFGSKVNFCDLDIIFPDDLYRRASHDRPKRKRGSSAEWSKDLLSRDEIGVYKLKMGHNIAWNARDRNAAGACSGKSSSSRLARTAPTAAAVAAH